MNKGICFILFLVLLFVFACDNAVPQDVVKEDAISDQVVTIKVEEIIETVDLYLYKDYDQQFQDFRAAKLEEDNIYVYIVYTVPLIKEVRLISIVPGPLIDNNIVEYESIASGHEFQYDPDDPYGERWLFEGATGYSIYVAPEEVEFKKIFFDYYYKDSSDEEDLINEEIKIILTN